MQTTYQATYETIDYTSSAMPDEFVLVRCRVTNRGSIVWRPDGKRVVNVAYRWLDERGQPIVADGMRTPLPHVVNPGETAVCELFIEAPERIGTLVLEIDLVAEGVAWFRDMQQPTLRLPVTIDPPILDKPRVCILNPNLLPNDAVCNSIMDQVRYFKERNYHVTVLAEYVAERLPVDIRRCAYAIQLHQLQHELNTLNLSWGARQFQQAHIYIYHYGIYYSLIETIPQIKHGTIIFDYHGVTPPEFWTDPAKKQLILKSQKFTSMANYADKVIVHSEYMLDELSQNSGFNRRKATVIPYVVQIEQFMPKEPSQELLERYDLHGNFVLLYIGRMAGNKRIDDLVRILAAVRQQHPHTKLVLVGDNVDPVYVQCCDAALALAESLGCRDQVVFTGPMPHEALVDFYNLCHVYMTASLHEGFCVPVIEAMACGKPVVATEAAALPSTIGEAGLFFPPKDAQRGAEQVLCLLADCAPHPAMAPADPVQSALEIVEEGV